jgi:hydroxyethylthiazole kinase
MDHMHTAVDFSPETGRKILAMVRSGKPLVHNITNHVVMNWTANVLLCAGASPAMVHAIEEVEEFVSFSQALVINIGTLDAPFVEAMLRATRRAREKSIPWVLDPVGVGATAYRNTVCAQLVGNKPAVIRGNASEIIALAGIAGSRTKGVDSTVGSDEAIEAAKALVIMTGSVVAVTGATDYVVGATSIMAIKGGHPMSQDVTGTGCATSALVGAFLAVAPPQEAAASALKLMKAAATSAAIEARGPGTFAAGMLDALANPLLLG